MIALKKAFDCDYVELHVVGEQVEHFHIHLIPRNLGEDIRGPLLHTKKGAETIAKILLCSFLSNSKDQCLPSDPLH